MLFVAEDVILHNEPNSYGIWSVWEAFYSLITYLQVE